MKINPAEWKFEFKQRGGHPPLMADLYCRALWERFSREIDLDVSSYEYLITSENNAYHKEAQRKDVIEKFTKRLEDRKYLQYIFDRTLTVTEDFLAFMSKPKGQITWDEFSQQFQILIPWFFIPWYITEFNLLSDKVVKQLEGYRKQIEQVTDFNSASMLLMFPDKQMEFQKEQESFYKLVELTKSGVDIFKDPNGLPKVQYHLSEFGWMSTFVIMPLEPLSAEGLKDKIAKAIQEKSDETYQLQETRRAEDIETTAKLMKIIQDDKELIELVTSAKYISWLLTYAVELALKAFALGIPWYKELCQKIGISYQDWVYLTVDEIEQSLKLGKFTISATVIESRKKGFVFVKSSDASGIVSGDEALDLISQINLANRPKDTDTISEIRGKSASIGKVRGTVKVAFSAGEAYKVDYGDILVCSMTSPDFVPAMKRAGAIVTDEGGLLCHAAIISRELGKPCVIATKVATQVLKDGDVVEVDAEKGIVKLIK